MKQFLRPLMLGALMCGLVALAACERAATPQPIELAGNEICTLDGMALADFPGPKGEIIYEQGAPDFFCDTVELVAMYLRPEERRRAVAVYTQDMGSTGWEHPQGHWIDATKAYFVIGAKKTGSMGPTLGTFAAEADARAFAAKEGGRVLRFDEITPDMVTLDGGVLKDGKM